MTDDELMQVSIAHYLEHGTPIRKNVRESVNYALVDHYAHRIGSDAMANASLLSGVLLGLLDVYAVILVRSLGINHSEMIRAAVKEMAGVSDALCERIYQIEHGGKS